MKEAVNKAKAVLLEPVMKVEATTPGEYQGDIIGDMNRRRGGCGYRVWAGSAACAVSTNRSSTVGASLTKNALCPEVWLSECAVSECATGSVGCARCVSMPVDGTVDVVLLRASM